MDDTSADQGADLNQSSGIFGEEKKGIFAQIGEKFGGFFRGIARTLGKIAVEKKSPDDGNPDHERDDFELLLNIRVWTNIGMLTNQRDWLILLL